MIIEFTDWNLDSVITESRESFVSDQLKGRVYKAYLPEDRITLFNLVYDFAVSKVQGVGSPPAP